MLFIVLHLYLLRNTSSNYALSTLVKLLVGTQIASGAVSVGTQIASGAESVGTQIAGGVTSVGGVIGGGVQSVGAQIGNIFHHGPF